MDYSDSSGNQLVTEGDAESRDCGFGGTVDGTSWIWIPSCNRADVDNCSGVAFFHTW